MCWKIRKKCENIQCSKLHEKIGLLGRVACKGQDPKAGHRWQTYQQKTSHFIEVNVEIQGVRKSKKQMRNKSKSPTAMRRQIDKKLV